METKFCTILACVTLLISFIIIERLTLPETTAEMTLAAEQYVLTSKKDTPPTPFSQDGCSLFIDSFFGHDFSEACLEHDISYWVGGPISERKQADIALREKIAHTGPLGPILAPIMYAGIRVFGDSFITKAVDANWGYGWN